MFLVQKGSNHYNVQTQVKKILVKINLNLNGQERIQEILAIIYYHNFWFCAFNWVQSIRSLQKIWLQRRRNYFCIEQILKFQKIFYLLNNQNVKILIQYFVIHLQLYMINIVFENLINTQKKRQKIKNYFLIINPFLHQSL
ncbi:unnamed protein product [Paramecium sonneborni]|uniref:Transmembrane protein n=1 Tax=Paramecium sonneborni TaxID=65129 RepID=A0A8S1M0X3_9CILI|nr:unnamed protein product [Paramecium sonneborni]